MYFEKNDYEVQLPPDITVTPPVNELFMSPDIAADVLAADIQQETKLLWQFERHSEHVANVESVSAALPFPAPTIERALAAETITERQIERLYRSLSEVLSDDDTARLALYLPLDILPKRSWRPDSTCLQLSLDTFRESYMQAWYSLLGTQDVRANFVDGDVLEESYRDGDPARVVKAAHLIPALINRGMISEADVAFIEAQAEDAEDSVLLQSLEEARMAMHGELAPSAPPSVDFPENISPRRRAWLLRRQHENEIAAAAQAVTASILADSPSPQSSPEVLAEGIYQAILHEAGNNPPRAAALYTRYGQTLHDLWNGNDSSIRQRLTRTYRRLHNLGVVDGNTLSSLGIDRTKLAGKLSENLSLLPDDIGALKRITGELADHPDIGQYVYPVALLGGSRLKGYGEQDSDVDVGVFIRPGTPEAIKPQLREFLAASFQNDGKQYEPLEFWIDSKDNGTLGVRAFDELDMHAADKYWTHTLFSGAWIGDEATIAQLQQQLLPAYFDGKDPARRLYLERLEQDSLQYRLMHKGYERHYPLQLREDWTRNDAIGGDSVYWDPGYRWLATRLFVDKVFLPKL